MIWGSVVCVNSLFIRQWNNKACRCNIPLLSIQVYVFCESLLCCADQAKFLTLYSGNINDLSLGQIGKLVVSSYITVKIVSLVQS